MNGRFKISSLLLAGLLATASLHGAVIEGHVTLAGGRTAPVVSKRYEVVSKAGVIATNPPLAVVYLEGVFPAAEEPAVVQMEQKDLAFVPLLLPVRTGTRVEFPNHDDTFHDVFSFSPAKRFDLGRYRPEDRPIPSQVFDTPGLVTLRCDIHEHMRGLVLVLDTPYFAVTDATGQFRLEGVPEGRYRLKAWLNSRQTLEQDVEIRAGETLRADFP